MPEDALSTGIFTILPYGGHFPDDAKCLRRVPHSVKVVCTLFGMGSPAVVHIPACAATAVFNSAAKSEELK
jgi:hypothetical protein